MNILQISRIAATSSANKRSRHVTSLSNLMKRNNILNLSWDIAARNNGFSDKIVLHSDEWVTKYLEYIHFHGPIEDPGNARTPKDQVTYHLFNNENKQDFIDLDEENLENIDEDIDKLFILIHGWLEHRERPWYEDLKNALLHRYPKSNVIQVDYREPAFHYYVNAMCASKYIGEYVGDFLVTINEKKKISPKKMIIIAHSLGSHVAGKAAKRIQQSIPRISRIISLDPAGPPFNGYPCEKRLCESDADTVAVLHSDIELYGYKEPLGTIDFYPNGGADQKGCPIIEKKIIKASEDTMCNHWRSWAYFIEALQNPDHFVSRRCKDWDTFTTQKSRCDQVTVTLGDLESSERGVFYFETRENAPFAIENEERIKTEL